MSKFDNKNALKLQVSTYLEESLSMIGRMMLEDIFTEIDITSEDEATAYVEAHYEENIFELIAPYLQHASEEYEVYKRTPEGQAAMEELKVVMEEAKQAAIEFNKTRSTKPSGSNNDNEGSGNVH